MSNGVSVPGLKGPGTPPMRLLSVIAVALLATACSHQAGSPGASPASSAGKIPVSATDRAACTDLLGRLEHVTQTISASSELMANSLNAQQLNQRIAYEASQLRQAADLMAQRPVPAPLEVADHDLVSALRTFSNDFTRAHGVAGQGDMRAAVEAMTDRATVQRIVDASKTIEDSCQ